MSYRNDYDAAKARLDVLEAEHAQLLAENSRLRGSTHATTAVPLPDARRPSATQLTFLIVIAALTVGFITLAATAP